jgi:glutaredoxin
MKVELLLSSNCAPCRKAQAVWESVCEEHHLVLELVDVEASEGAERFEDLDLVVLPALLLDGELVAVGVQDREQAAELLQKKRGQCK